jgi:hypothetical protein
MSWELLVALLSLLIAFVFAAGWRGARRRAEVAEASYQRECREHEATKVWLRLAQLNRARNNRERIRNAIAAGDRVV